VQMLCKSQLLEHVVESSLCFFFIEQQWRNIENGELGNGGELSDSSYLTLV
jgi:hypothetical protein